LIFTASYRSHATLKPTDITIPAQFGLIEKRVEGTSEKPFIFLIGEEHVSLKVQQAVADILRYLTGIYDLKLVCTEGYDKLFLVSKGNGSLIALRSIARADFDSRRISGVEYFARAYPDIAVVGVEDMNAYKQHAEQLDSLDQKRQQALEESKKLENDFQAFLQQDIVTMPLSNADVKAINALNKNSDFTTIADTLFNIVGRNSKSGKKLADLIDRRSALEIFAKDFLETSAVDSCPEMENRDKAMVAATQRTIQENKVDATILVVGKLHLPCIEKLLSSEKIPYVSILPIGVDERNQDDKQAEESQRIYQEWRKNQPTGIEAWFLSSQPMKIKNQPKISRLEARNRNSFLNILMSAYNLKNQSTSNEKVLEFINGAGLPSRIKIDMVFDIEGGSGFEFTINEHKGYAYFAIDPKHVIPPDGKWAIEKGENGGISYAIYDGGDGGGHPPIPPKSGGGGGGGNGFWGPNSNWYNNYLVAIKKEKDHQKQRVTVLFYFDTDQDAVRRQVDNGAVEVLDVKPSVVKILLNQYEKAPLGPEKIAAAMKLSDVLLVDLNKQLPAGKKELVLISKDDLLGKTSLTMLQSFVGEKSADHLKTLTTDYVVPWSKRESSLARLEENLENLEQIKKDQAEKQRADKAVKDEIGKEPLRLKIPKLTDVEKIKIAPYIQVLSHAIVIEK